MSYDPIIFIAGMPRAGSMWTYNVCRSLIRAVGKQPWPEVVPQDESAAIREALSRPPLSGQTYCIKTHFEIPLGKPHMRIICNYRDIRDAMLSFMRFTRCSFEKALAAARGSMKLTDHYLQAGDRFVHPVNYEQMTSSPVETIKAIAGFLSIDVSVEEIRRIAGDLSRESVQHRLEKLAAVEVDDSGRVSAEGKDGKLSSAMNQDGSFRVYDHETGFQSNHIGTHQDGEWRKVLSDAEQAELMEAASDWLLRYGFRP